jgi:putative drug exporter of the RND superfamily
MTFAIVFGLSTDYQVFLLSRIKEEWDAHHDNARAVHDGISRVSGIITGAVIMIAVFGSFVVGGQRLLQEIGTGFAVAVALDAFLIRFILVPALMYILGDRNWQLPARLTWLPRIHIEPDETPEAPTAPRAAWASTIGARVPPPLASRCRSPRVPAERGGVCAVMAIVKSMINHVHDYRP